MSSKLGYTFYPKDFASDPDVMLMSSSERGIYRDLIDLAYSTDNKIEYGIDALCRYTNGKKKEVQKVLDMKGEKCEGFWKIPSCDKRIAVSKKNRANGKGGGRPSKQNPDCNPKGIENNNPNENQEHNPESDESETQSKRQREREREREREDEDEIKREPQKTQSPSTSTPAFISISRAQEILDFTKGEFALLAIRRTKKTVEQLSAMVPSFVQDQSGYGKMTWQNEPDLKQHFINWVNKQETKQPDIQSQEPRRKYVIGKK